MPAETTKHFKGAFFSPFTRAYTPELEAHGISQSDFLTFIDGLNEAFVANPAFQGLGIAGRVMGMVYGVHAVQWAGLGLEAGAGLANAATSYVRTRMYVKAMNKDLFHPVGLSLTILTTKKMMEKVKYPQDKLQLPPLEWNDDLDNDTSLKPKEIARRAAEVSEQEDPRIRRIKALEGYVLPIDLDVPEAVAPDNMLKKVGAAQARRMEAKQSRKLTKRRSKGERKYIKKNQKAERRQSKGELRIENLERELENDKIELDRQMAGMEDQQQRQVAMKEFEKKETKLKRKMEKRASKMDRKVNKSLNKADKRREKVDKREHKIAHKVRWIVISRWEGHGDLSDDSLSPSDSEDESNNTELPTELEG